MSTLSYSVNLYYDNKEDLPPRDRHVRAVHTHDWIHTGGHVYGRGREGTVDGAIASGQRAAHRLLRTFR